MDGAGPMTAPITAEGVVGELRAVLRTFALDSERDVQAARDTLAGYISTYSRAMQVKVGQLVIGRRTAADAARNLTTDRLTRDEIQRRLIRLSLQQMATAAPRPGDDYEHLIARIPEARSET